MKKNFIVQPKNQIKAASSVKAAVDSIPFEFLHEWACTDAQNGLPVNDFDEFRQLASDDGYSVTEEDFRKYWDMYDECSHGGDDVKSSIKASTDYKLIDKLVKDYEDDYVRGKPLSTIWNEITKKHRDSKLARAVVEELEKTNKKVDYYDEDAERDPDFVKDREDKKDIKSGCGKKKIKASDEDDYDEEGCCKKCGRKLTDMGSCPVCDDGEEERFADGVDDEDIEGCNIKSASASELSRLSRVAEKIADDLEEWLSEFIEVPDAEGHISDDDLSILDQAQEILYFAAQSLRGYDEIL